MKIKATKEAPNTEVCYHGKGGCKEARKRSLFRQETFYLYLSKTYTVMALSQIKKRLQILRPVAMVEVGLQKYEDKTTRRFAGTHVFLRMKR